MKLLRSLFIATAILSAAPARAHDEGHGPKLADTGKFGGLVRAIVEKKEAGLGTKAKLHYKAELLRSSEGKVQVFIYDPDMKPLDAASWGKEAKVTALPRKKGAKTKTFVVTFDGKAFVGQLPEGLAKPFDLDFVFSEKSRELLAAFDNQD